MSGTLLAVVLFVSGALCGGVVSFLWIARSVGDAINEMSPEGRAEFIGLVKGRGE